ncbi:MAG: TIGR02757 family protein [Victivallales bacterium]|nr:TIGR02757 family protein [Victivallales bacterium]
MTQEMASRIRDLAEQYEKQEFLMDDPSGFMHRYTETRDVEIVALIAAALAFGKRSEILSHIETFLSFMGQDTPTAWLLSERFKDAFPDSTKSFYRIFTFRSIRLMCETLADIVSRHGSLGECLEKEYKCGACDNHPGRLATLLAEHFPDDCSPLIAKSEQSANKRLNLFLRWMVRANSPVDLGLWTWYPASELIMPMDTHVLAVARQFGLMKGCGGATLRQAIALTDILKTVFPEDPLKGDFALFGYGVTNGI